MDKEKYKVHLEHITNTFITAVMIRVCFAKFAFEYMKF